MAHRQPLNVPLPRAALGTIAMLLFALAPPLGAQACDCRAPLFPARWSVFVSTGAALTQTSAINARLATDGYAAVSDDAIVLGLGGYGSFGPLRLGAESVTLDAGEESTPSGRFARLQAHYSTITLGWDLVPRARYSIVPTLGIGRGEYTLTVGDVSGGAGTPSEPPPSFDEVLAAPGSVSRLSGGHWLWEPMIAGDFLLTRGAARTRGITLGLRAGYRIAPNRPEWRYRGARASGGPVDQAAGAILRLTVGVGGR